MLLKWSTQQSLEGQLFNFNKTKLCLILFVDCVAWAVDRNRNIEQSDCSECAKLKKLEKYRSVSSEFLHWRLKLAFAPLKVKPMIFILLCWFGLLVLHSDDEYVAWPYFNLLILFAERFTVLSYNILADYLAINHRSKLYFHIPRHILDWEYRKRSIIFELGLWSADILCFQVIIPICL